MALKCFSMAFPTMVSSLPKNSPFFHFLPLLVLWHDHFRPIPKQLYSGIVRVVESGLNSPPFWVISTAICVTFVVASKYSFINMFVINRFSFILIGCRVNRFELIQKCRLTVKSESTRLSTEFYCILLTFCSELDSFYMHW